MKNQWLFGTEVSGPLQAVVAVVLLVVHCKVQMDIISIHFRRMEHWLLKVVLVWLLMSS
jgi:hypothetical protein